MYMRTLVGKEEKLGENHASTLDTVFNLGNVYRSQDKLDEAEQMYRRALAGTKKSLGEDHPSKVEIVDSLMKTYIVPKADWTRRGSCSLNRLVCE